MDSKGRTTVAALAILVVVALSIAAPFVLKAGASNAQPANKVVASGSTILLNHTSAGSSLPIPLLEADFKSSNPTDLMIMVSMETALYTKVKASGGQIGESVAVARIEVQVKIDGIAVPVTNIPVGGGPDDGKVTFDYRVFGVKYNLTSLTELEFLELWIETKSAHAFNWIKLNVGQGEHHIVVEAVLSATSDVPQGAWSAVGKRTLIVEPCKMANNAEI